MTKKRLLILGVTASGKASLGFHLAQELDTEIISVDSMKVYRRMDIGTAKASEKARAQIPYHLVDVVEPSEAFSVGMFHDQAETAAQIIEQKDKPVIAVGGTALYIKALLYGLFDGPGADETIRQALQQRAEEVGPPHLHQELQSIDPEAAERINPNDARRIIRALEVFQLTGKPISSFQTQFEAPQPNDQWLLIGLRRPKEQESMRINARVKRMVSQGLLEEVESLLAEPIPLSKQAAAAIGYAEIISHLQGEIDFDQAVERIKINTRRLAKHQRTWYRTFPNIHWLETTDDTTLEQLAKDTLTIWQKR